MVKVCRSAAVFVLISACANAQTTNSAADLVHAALAAMGGEDKIRNLSAVHVEAFSIRNELEESERPEGPYILENDTIEEWRDLAHNNWKSVVKMHGPMQPEFVINAVVSGGVASRSFDGQAAPASGEQLQQAEEILRSPPSEFSSPL